MSNAITTGISFEKLNLCPQYLSDQESLEKSVINSISIVTGIKWRSVVRSLVEQAHIRGNMPTYRTCLTDLLRAKGFVPTTFWCPVSELVQTLNSLRVTDEKFIIKIRGNNYCALIYDYQKKQYKIKGTITGKASIEQRCIDEIWVYVPGSDNRTGIIKKPKGNAMPTGCQNFTAKNMNPDGRLIGDCVIRALSAVYDCTWHEAIDYIANATNYDDPTLNSLPNVNITLIKLGFERHKGIKSGGKYMNGKDLCKILDYTYHDGEKVFAFVGRSHCAAILPTKENGETKYKLQDTWDSTSRGIIEYWVYKKPVVKNTVITQSNNYEIGGTISHPQYGNGKIVSIIGEGTNRFLEIAFAGVGNKKISEAWLVRKNKLKGED